MNLTDFSYPINSVFIFITYTKNCNLEIFNGVIMNKYSLLILVLLLSTAILASGPERDTTIVTIKNDTLRGVAMEPMLSSFDRCSYTTYGNNASTSVVVHWGTSSNQNTVLAYGITHSMLDTITVSGTRENHHVLLTGLFPGTTYYYSVVGESYSGEFRTAPVARESFSFAAFGDNRTNHDNHRSVVDAIDSELDIEFVLNVGDLVADGGSTSDWEMFFQVEQDMLANHVMMPAKGNHDVSFWPWDPDPIPEYWDLDLYGSFDYSNCHFVWLDSEVISFSSQQSWLTTDLAAARANPNIDWIFVWFHRPPFSAGNHGDNNDTRDAFVPILKDYEVDMVFLGHDHSYERTLPIGGTIYIITGGGGAPLYGIDPGDNTCFCTSQLEYTKVIVTGDDIHVFVKNPYGEVIDELQLHHGPEIVTPSIVYPTLCKTDSLFEVTFKHNCDLSSVRAQLLNRHSSRTYEISASSPVHDSLEFYHIDCSVLSTIPKGLYDLCLIDNNGYTDTVYNAVSIYDSIPSSFKFMHITDLHHGSTIEHYENLVHTLKVVNLVNPSFVIATGDIADNGSRRESFEVIEMIKELHVPLFMVPGNHDYEYWDGVDPYIDVINPVLNYSFDFGTHHFVMMNTKYDNGFPFYRCYGLNMQDLLWLENDLAEHTDAAFTTVGFHGPVFDELTPNLNGMDDYVSICSSNNVKLTLSGHTHFNKIHTESGSRYYGSWPGPTGPLFIQTASCAKNETFTVRHDFRLISVQGDEFSNLTCDENGDGERESDTAWDIWRLTTSYSINPESTDAVVTISNENYEPFSKCRIYLNMTAGYDYYCDGGDIVDIALNGHLAVEFDIESRSDNIVHVYADPLSVRSSSVLPNQLSLKAYPNPFNSAININTNIESQIAIYNVNGNLVKKARALKGHYIWEPSRDIPSGLYMVKASNGKDIQTGYITYIQ